MDETHSAMHKHLLQPAETTDSEKNHAVVVYTEPRWGVVYTEPQSPSQPTLPSLRSSYFEVRPANQTPLFLISARATNPPTYKSRPRH